MGLFGKFFGKRDTPASGTGVWRGPKAVSAEPGTEDAAFLREAGAILRCDATAVDLSKDIHADYGCDELDVVELLQVAEDLWGVSLMPNPFQDDDVKRAVKTFRTLSDIIGAAKAKRSM